MRHPFREQWTSGCGNLGRGVITVVPLTTNTAHVFPFQMLVEPDESGLVRASKVQA